MKMIFVRHGETDHNKLGIAQGTLDVPLNAVGRQQAKKAGANLPNEIDVIFSSPQARAYETALIINETYGVDVVKRDELSERKLGKLEGRKWEEFTKEVGMDKYEILRTSSHGIETLESVEKRIVRFLEDTRKGSYTFPLIVTHAGIVRQMHFMHHKEEIGKIHNASMHEFEI